MPSEFLNALKTGAMLQEYQIVRVLGAGGFGLTYLAFDQNLDKPVAIKEYLPDDLSIRSGEAQVLPKSTTVRDDFKWGLDQFLNEARILAKFNHPNIIRINRFFEANGTGYIVMDYAEGQSLSEKIKNEGPLDELHLKSILLAIADGLRQAHGYGILHRDIKPGNIMLLADGTPILIDFGSARQAIGVKSKSVTSIVTPGFAPIEQYDTNGKQGPWSDIYALGAVAYTALVGERPPDSTGRIRIDKMVPATISAKGRASPEFLEAIDFALQPQEESRPQSIDQWIDAMEKGWAKPKSIGFDDEKTILHKKSSTKMLDEEKPAPLKPEPAGSAPKKSSSARPWILSILVVTAIILTYPLWNAPIQQEHQSENASEVVFAENENIETPPVNEQSTSDEQAWAIATTKNTIEGYIEYQMQFPNGRHFNEANETLSGLSGSDHNGGNLYSQSAVNIRQWPSTEAMTVGSLNAAQAVTIEGKVLGRDWYRIVIADEGVAFVHADLLKSLPPHPQASDDVATEQERADIKKRWRDAIAAHNR